MEQTHTSKDLASFKKEDLIAIITKLTKEIEGLKNKLEELSGSGLAKPHFTLQ